MQRSLQEISRVLQRPLIEILDRDLAGTSCQKVSYINLAKRAFLESLYRDLIKRSWQEISCRDFAQRSCQETFYRDLYRDLAIAKRSLTEILPTELL